MTQPAPQDPLSGMITGSWVSPMVHVAAKLGLPDRLAVGPKTADELAQTTETHPRSLYRLLRALAGVGIFSEDEDQRFAQTPLSGSLRRDVPGSQWAMAVMTGDEHYHAWGDLLESVRTGRTAFDRLYGKPVFEYPGEHPEQAEVFDAAMTSIHGRETDAVLDADGLSGVGVLADIGGGNGSNLTGVPGRYPEMRGVLLDLPHVVGRAAANLERAGLSGRCEVVGGDFFGSISVQADAYFLRQIVHDWDDEKAGMILRNLRTSMPERAKLPVVEHVLPPGNEPSFGKPPDLNMLLPPGGVERTADEFRRLFEVAGFRLTRIVPSRGDLSVVEGEPVRTA